MSTAPIRVPEASAMATFLSNDPEDDIPEVETINPSIYSNTSSYSVPRETERILKEGIIANPLIAPNLPPDVEKYASLVSFTGNDKPNIPVNWRFAESISALKALESIWINNLLVEK